MNSKLIIAFVLGVVTSSVIGALLWQNVDIPPERLHAQLLAQPEFLADHPDLFGGAQAVLQSRRLAAAGAQRLDLMRGKWRFLTHVAFTPALGPADASEVLLEFTDYTCVPCRASAPFVREVLSEGRNFRVAILLLPLGGALADYSARVALAAYRQDPERFAELHHRLLDEQAPLTQQTINNALRDLQFDVEQIERESHSAESRRYFQQVRQFAEELEVSGVPAFLLNDRLLQGGVTSDQLDELIDSSNATGKASVAVNTNVDQ